MKRALALAALLATGTMDIGAFGAAIEAPTLILLFALMIVSAQFSGAGFYDRWAAAMPATTPGRAPTRSRQRASAG